MEYSSVKAMPINDMKPEEHEGAVSVATFDNAKRRWDIIVLFAVTSVVALVGVPLYGYVKGFSASSWVAFALLFSLGNLAITTGYHRLWSHKTYQAHWSVRLALAVVGAMTLQNTILKWASDHRRHHGHLDDVNLDPYCAKRGFWFSHIGWMLRDYPSAVHDYNNVKDLQRDKIVMFQERYYLPLAIAMNILVPTLLGLIWGNVLEMLLVAGFLRLVLNHHCTFFINSLAHIIGHQPYDTRNTSRDNAVLAVLTFGEGYHNFHHSFPGDYRNGIRWYHYDPTKWLIAALSILGLAKKLRRMPLATIENRRDHRLQE